jgi:23S rRNA (pseudouridine1915-N3)-methyltransferase
VKLLIIAVGDKMPGWVETACAEYVKRMPREARIELIEVKPEKRGGQSVDKIKALEAARILEKLPKGARLVALDEHGQTPDTKGLAQLLQDWLAEGRDVALVIGGADGLAPELLQKAEMKLALSRLTLPHGMVRVLLSEQLYRAMSLLQGHPYHRE